MHLEKLELQGFKSFAKRTIFEFMPPKEGHNSVTLIVGPNGSGKSNVSDAIRWVLGEQSLKLIRGKKTEDVIFSGSEKKARLGFAEVSLYLNNEDGQAPIDYSQIVITRRIYRDGQSEYLLNKNPVRLFDINLLLAKAHFGQKSFSIIGQGMIDSVLLATPLERKDFFDEAVGVKEHQIKRHQALNKLERSEENLREAGLMLKELSPQLRSLTRQVKRLERREQLQAQLSEYQHEYYHRLWSGLNMAKNEQKKSVEELEKQIEKISEDLNEKRAELESIEKSATRGQVFTDLQNQYQAKNQEKNRLLRELTVIKGRLEIDLEKQGQLDLAWLYRQEEEINEKIIENQKESDHLKLNLKNLSAQKIEKTERFNQAKNKIENLTKQIELVKNQLKDEATKGPLSVIGRHVKELVKNFQKFTCKLREQNADLEQLREQAETIQSQINDLGQTISLEMEQGSREEQVKLSESQEIWNLQQELNNFINDHDKTAPETTQLEIQIQVLREKINLKNRDIDALETELKRINQDLTTKQAAQKGEDMGSKIVEQQKSLEKDTSKLDKEIMELKNRLDAFNADEEAKQQKVFRLEREYQELQQEFNRVTQKQNTIAVELARTETKLEDLNEEIRRELKDPTVVQAHPEHTGTDFETLPTDHLFSQIEKIKYQLELIGGIDPETVEEYKQVKERHDFLENQINDLEKTMQQLEKVIIELDNNIASQFDKAFNIINKNFEKYFQILFGGGRAKLIKVMEEEKEKTIDSNDQKIENEQEIKTENEIELNEDETEEKLKRSKRFRKTDVRGIDIYASPPGKKLSTISMLSGGERSLTSLALIAAIIYHNPSPFILMDEVDAALDEANSQRMARVLDDLRKYTQFVLITHNRTIMNIANSIYGVTMGNDGVSSILSIKLEEVDKHSTRL